MNGDINISDPRQSPNIPAIPPSLLGLLREPFFFVSFMNRDLPVTHFAARFRNKYQVCPSRLQSVAKLSLP
jgi:hypothetical protein